MTIGAMLFWCAIMIKSIVDKTVKAVEQVNSSNDILIRFHDDSVISITAQLEESYGNAEAKLQVTDQLSDYELVKLGLMTVEEMKKRYEKKLVEAQKKAAKEASEQELAIFEKLKRKYEPAS